MGLLGSIGSMLGVGDDAPDVNAGTNAAIGKAQDANLALGNRMADLGQEQLDFTKARSAEFDPYYKEALGTQTDIAKKSQAMSDQQWQRYLDLYAPVEQRQVQDANTWDSPENIDRVQQQARAEAGKNFDAARGQAERERARTMINPASGRSNTENLALEIGQASAGTNSANQAAEQRRMEALNLRNNAVNTGRNFPTTSLAANQTGLSAANNEVGTTNSAIMTPTGARATSLPYFGAAAGANTSAGQLGLGTYGTQANIYGKQLDTENDLLGSGIAAVGAMFASSEELKTDKEPVNDDMILEGIETLPVEAWRYKPGLEMGGKRHVGPYAEDVQQRFGDEAAPGGEMIDSISMHGLTLSAIKALAKKVKKLESGGGLESGYRRAGGRDTEPRRVS